MALVACRPTPEIRVTFLRYSAATPSQAPPPPLPPLAPPGALGSFSATATTATALQGQHPGRGFAPLLELQHLRRAGVRTDQLSLPQPNLHVPDPPRKGPLAREGEDLVLSLQSTGIRRHQGSCKPLVLYGDARGDAKGCCAHR